MANPTVQRRRLGNALKRAREAAGKTQDEAAAIIDAAASKISRFELGQSGVRLTDLAHLLDFYGVTGEEAESMRDLARAGRQRGRWSTYRDALPGWFRQYVDLESDASEIRWYQSEVVPGILQTGPYIRAILDGGPSEEIDRQVQVRLQRQSALDESDSTELSFVLSESAIRRTVGNAATMREQLAFLAELSRRPGVTIQVLPFSARSYVSSVSFPFVMLRFDHDAASDVIYVEDYTDASYLDRPSDVRVYTRLWDELKAAALGPVESRHLITTVADQFREESGS
ncbi:helix-turn-helix domain-containing protein [Krasilnikovia sp. MM14-A1259]|uniref:helix-turn-helix domain-containing protein n=1 Tax=Krasilnikovia sp. MM14-A1259 TaxID=3373539 RepID=UPI00381D5EDF